MSSAVVGSLVVSLEDEEEADAGSWPASIWRMAWRTGSGSVVDELGFELKLGFGFEGFGAA